MGCIVNGPGEMADADFGYVGGAPGKIDLYVGKVTIPISWLPKSCIWKSYTMLARAAWSSYHSQGVNQIPNTQMRLWARDRTRANFFTCSYLSRSCCLHPAKSLKQCILFLSADRCAARHCHGRCHWRLDPADQGQWPMGWSSCRGVGL